MKNLIFKQIKLSLQHMAEILFKNLSFFFAICVTQLKIYKSPNKSSINLQVLDAHVAVCLSSPTCRNIMKMV